MKSQAQKAAEFEALHTAPGCFVIPNPWDAGSARILAGLGFKALTTTSIGYARAIGVTDYNAGREHVMEHIRLMAPATDLPLAADLENGFGHKPEDCAETIRQGAAAGLVGGSIEDATGDKGKPIYEIAAAADRIRASAEAASKLPFKFMLVGRAENHLHGVNDLKDTIRRLQAYQEAGADVLFAPGLATGEDVRTVCREIDRPFNINRGPRNEVLSVAQLAELGVKRVSLGGGLQVAAMTGFIAAAKEIAEAGTFGFVKGLVGGAELDGLIDKGEGRLVKAYLVLDFSIKDLAGFSPYVAAIPAHIARHGGRYIVRGEPPTPIEGGWTPERMVILEFPTRANAEAFLSDPDIQDLFKTRHTTTTSRLVLVDGCT